MSVEGLLIVDKPGGMTSHDVVARVRRAFRTRKVGHAGTLDPMATGVLVLGVGRATRLLGLLALRDKEYRATLRLGVATTTDDADGVATSCADPADVLAIDDDRLRSVLDSQRGLVQQRPSSVSAIKVGGRRAHALVRAGQEVVLPSRTVEISRLEVEEIRRTGTIIDVDVDVACSTGTYIRAIARDVGTALAVGGHLTALRRTRVGPFTLAEATSLARIEAAAQAIPAEVVVAFDDVAARCFATLTVDGTSSTAVRHGRRIPWPGAPATGGKGSEPVAILGPTGQFLALAVDDAGLARYHAVFADLPGSPSP